MKWTREACISDAKMYSTRSDWAKGSSSAYQAARRNDWLEECCKHMGGASQAKSEAPSLSVGVTSNPAPTNKVYSGQEAVSKLKSLLDLIEKNSSQR